MFVQSCTYNNYYKYNAGSHNCYAHRAGKRNYGETISFNGNNFKFVKDFARYAKARLAADALYAYVKSSGKNNSFVLREYSMEPLEGIQYGIKVFDGITMKDIQYMSENLHVIAVKRGCNNMCGYCYADAKPQKREMSWEDFTCITQGFKKLIKRFHGLDIFGENLPLFDPVSRTTELFYDSDCMALAVKDKRGRVHDFIELAQELYDSLKRKTVFDTSGWDKNSPSMQKRAEKYAEYFGKPENMSKLAAFNVSFNVFNASYIASVKALSKGNSEKAEKLRNRYTDNMANTLYTFTPLIDKKEFNIITRAFGNEAKNAKYFNVDSALTLATEVLDKLRNMYNADFNGARKYIKAQDDIAKLMNIAARKMLIIDTALNPSGRMKDFMKAFNIKAKMQNHDETTPIIIENLKQAGRFHKYLMERLIDTDGKVYHMDYARFIPTEIQLNIPNKQIPAPELANKIKDFVLTKDIINRPEILQKG